MRRLAEALMPYHKKLCLFAHRRDQDIPELSGAQGYEFHFPADLAGLTDEALHPIRLNRSALMERTRLGDRIMLVYAPDGTLAHRTFVQVRGIVGIEGDRRAFRLDPGHAYLHFCETAIAHRGRSLYPLALTRILRELAQDLSFREAWICCRIDNHSSVQGIVKAGFERRFLYNLWGVLNGRLRIRLVREMDPPPVDSGSRRPTAMH